MIKPEKTLYEYRQELHISKSQIRSFLMCSQKYYYQYVRGLKWESKPSALSFGSAVHEAVAEYYRSINAGKPLTKRAIHKIFKDAWNLECKGDVPIKFNNGDKDTMLEMGKEMLKTFIENIKPRKVEAVELPFSVPIINPATGEVSSIRLVGAFDLIEADEDGNLSIVELKTAARKWSDGQAETELDSSIYAYALKEMGYSTNGSETLVRFDVLLKTKTPSLETYYATKNEKDQLKAISLASKVLHAIEAEAFYPNHGWQCNGCPFKKHCADDV